ncbi:MAG TPA: hypothetical protein VH134_01745 [Candidatus Dormibacteraeota bacterium]|nr:hypothetical protein [Candidatus Dormibacteraeota bacterium]
MLRSLRLPALMALTACATGCVNDLPSDRPPAAARAAATAAPAPAHIAVLQPGGLAFVDRYGRPEARATFGPLPAEPQVAAGAVYVLDAGGAVRRLSPAGGGAEVVATFPTAPRAAAAAFAVSPDGGRVIASLLGAAGHPRYVDLELGVAGGPATLLRRIPVARGATTAPRVVGWDGAGPVVLPDAAISAAPAVPGALWGGHPVHADLHGRLGPPLGDGTCSVSREQPEGDLICVAPVGSGMYAAGVYSEGELLHRFAPVGADPLLAPGEERIAFAGDAGRTTVEGVDGHLTLLPAAAGVPVGWLDAGTVIGSRAGRLTSSPVSPAGPVADLAVAGEVVGVIR